MTYKKFKTMLFYFRKFQKAAYFLTDCVKLGLHSSMLIAAVFAFIKLRRLDINRHPMSLLDDVLLFICLPAFVLETVLSMIATVNILNVLKSIDVIIMVRNVEYIEEKPQTA